MPDNRPSFAVLENATQDGVALRSVQQGESVSAKNGLLGFSFKDASGNAVAPQLTAEGKLPVDLKGAGISRSGAPAAGFVDGSVASFQLVAEATLTASKTHGSITAMGACFRETIFQVIQLNDVTETNLGEFLVGPGQFSFTFDGGETEFSTGSTGTQKLQLKAKNIDKAENLRGTISCLEFAV